MFVVTSAIGEYGPVICTSDVLLLLWVCYRRRF